MKRILLVEDEQALARHLTRLLQAEGFTVVHAATQRAAAACLEETPLDLALVDISLPDGNGFAVCTAIKQAQAIPVLFLTASADEDSVVTGCAWGAMTTSPSPSAHGSSWRGSPPPCGNPAAPPRSFPSMA